MLSVLLALYKQSEFSDQSGDVSYKQVRQIAGSNVIEGP